MATRAPDIPAATGNPLMMSLLTQLRVHYCRVGSWCQLITPVFSKKRLLRFREKNRFVDPAQDNGNFSFKVKFTVGYPYLVMTI